MQRVGVIPGNPVISFSGEIDMATCEAMSSALQPWTRAGGPLTIDLSDVSLIDSMGITVIVKAALDVGDRGCILVHGARGNVGRVLAITGIDAVSNVHVVGCCARVEEPRAGDGRRGLKQVL